MILRMDVELNLALSYVYHTLLSFTSYHYRWILLTLGEEGKKPILCLCSQKQKMLALKSSQKLGKKISERTAHYLYKAG